MAFIGVDLHTNSFTICRLRDDGSEAFETFTLSASAIQAFCMSLDADDEIAVEATGNTAWFCDEIRACVGRIVVVNPRQFQVIRKSVNKTDGAVRTMVSGGHAPLISRLRVAMMVRSGVRLVARQGLRDEVLIHPCPAERRPTA